MLRIPPEGENPGPEPEPLGFGRQSLDPRPAAVEATRVVDAVIERQRSLELCAQTQYLRWTSEREAEALNANADSGSSEEVRSLLQLSSQLESLSSILRSDSALGGGRRE